MRKFMLMNVMLFVPAFLMGNIRYVYQEDGAQGIQDSIDVSFSYDTVLVHDGSYYVGDMDSIGIIVKNWVVLMSANGAKSCTLSGLSSIGTDTAYHVIYCVDAKMIKGFTIKDGNANGDGSYGWGGGIYCYQSSPTIDSCIITKNSANKGGGLYIYYSSPTITDNTIANNLAGYYGGGFYIHNSSPTITNNLIANNSAIYGCGGGIFSDYSSSDTIKYCVIALNKSKRGGAIFSIDNSEMFIDSCFIIDNGNTIDANSGAVYMTSDAYTVSISHSHLYYNTFQPDIEIFNNTVIDIPLQNNYWWYTDSTTIGSLIEGPNDHSDWENDFITGVPGEPITVDSVRNYDSNYSCIVDSLENDPDTLYIRIYGEDRNAKFREAAVAIIKSTIYPEGIAVALLETDTNSGIYQGKAIIKVSTGNDTMRIDDIYNIVRANSAQDTITITANMDTMQKFVVFYKSGAGVEEASNYQLTISNYQLSIYPNPFTAGVSIEFRVQSSELKDKKLSTLDSQLITLKIYDLSGRLIKSFPLITNHLPLTTAVEWDGKNESGNKVSSGVYFCRLEAGEYVATKKLILVK